VPSYLAKGLEFDAVILPNVSDAQYDPKEEKRLFYTLASRAMHDLRIINVGQVAQLIKKIDSKLYKEKKYE
ncbi:MAG: ATP-binding domain-containing protein, partial [Lactobacillaceae bacterium]|nr:ATP-binding domain-containing protein [Lactobacillaceae bacterium]